MRSLCFAFAIFILATGCQNHSESKSAPESDQLSEADITKGRKLYTRYGCAVCHGKTGRGKGQIARTLNPRPRDFHKPGDYKYGRSIEAISRTIEKGVTNNRGTGMPGYPHLPKAERKAIATYIVSLQAEK